MFIPYCVHFNYPKLFAVSPAAARDSENGGLRVEFAGVSVV